jgi:EAL domain-containing protein (putative c-di-GMP-specific phosphodiesterase class I)
MSYQPILSFETQSLYPYEALVRTRTPAIPHPGALLEAAERLVRLPELGRVIRAKIAEDIPKRPPGSLIFVNLHSQDLNDPALYDPDAPLSRFAEQVVLEVTERASLSHVRDLPTSLRQLRTLGFRLAIDDLGAGYAGLTSFAQLEPDVVKLDMSLVRSIDVQPVKQRLVKSMVSLCRELNVTVVGEGVETQGERDFLYSVGCELMQGYLFAKPAPPFVNPSF